MRIGCRARRSHLEPAAALIAVTAALLTIPRGIAPTPHDPPLTRRVWPRARDLGIIGAMVATRPVPIFTLIHPHSLRPAADPLEELVEVLMFGDFYDGGDVVGKSY